MRLLKLALLALSVVALGACTVATSTASSGDSEEPSTVESAVPDPDQERPTDDEPGQEEAAGSSSSESAVQLPDEANPRAESSDATLVEPGSNADAEPAGPLRLKIDVIDVDAYVERVGITPEGAMDVPGEWENAGWYEPGTAPGEQGNSVIAGHYDSPTSPAIFYELGDLQAGDRITVTTEDYEELVFEVTETESVQVDNAPLEKIFGSDTDERNLNLITCDGAWNPDTENYESRLVVYTTLISD